MGLVFVLCHLGKGSLAFALMVECHKLLLGLSHLGVHCNYERRLSLSYVLIAQAL